ncbi:MAG: acetyl-CoA carboxylase biotin carboxyl carrier protein subunit [Lewinella sp.]|nr:acetyl-CoA carboxylase biotin carboxyl carrier protein subunit [Lewinella sp.]
MEATNNYSATVNEEITLGHDELINIDAISEDGRSFHLLVGERAYRAELIRVDYGHKSFAIKVNGSQYNVKLSDAFDQMVDRLGLKAVAGHAAKEIHAPMPGLVLELKVKVGDEVHEGQMVAILEAMKMENVIKSPGDGVVKAVHVQKGAAVEKNALLIEME